MSALEEAIYNIVQVQRWMAMALWFVVMFVPVALHSFWDWIKK